jgi:hypothetical protein
MCILDGMPLEHPALPAERVTPVGHSPLDQSASAAIMDDE